MNTSAWRYYSRFFRGSYGVLFLTVALSVGQSLLVLPIAWLVRYAFDEIIPAGNGYRLLLAGAAVLALTVLNSGTALWTRYTAHKATQAAIRKLREELLDRCFAFSRSFYSEADLGRLHTNIVHDTDRLTP